MCNRSRPTSASGPRPSSEIMSPAPSSTKYTSSTKSQQCSSRPARKSCKNSKSPSPPTPTTFATSSQKSRKISKRHRPTWANWRTATPPSSRPSIQNGQQPSFWKAKEVVWNDFTRKGTSMRKITPPWDRKSTSRWSKLDRITSEYNRSSSAKW